MNINFFEFQIFSLIIIFQSFCKINSISSFDYPYSIILSNDNIFLIQKTGIDIYDKSLNKLNQIIDFSEEEEISEEKFSKIVIKYNNEYIFIIINDKIFIFNNEGKFLYKSEEKINNNQIIYSYSLTLLNVTNNNCDYILGYFDEDCNLNLNFFRYDNENNNITLLSNFKKQKYSYDYGFHQDVYFNSMHKILSCEYIYYSFTNYIICFFNDNPTLGINAYEIKKYNNKTYLSYVDLKDKFIYSRDLDNVKNITSIKSEINNNRTQAIVWWNYKNKNQTRYFIYKFKDAYLDYHSFFVPNTCINEENRTGINILHTKNQFVFSCVMQNVFAQALIYNKDDLAPTNDSYMLYASCENINGLSKLYFNNNKNYLIYSCFKNCSDKNYENDTYCINQKGKEDENKGKDEENKGKDEENKGKDEEKKLKNIILILVIIISVIIITFLIGLAVICMECLKNNRKNSNKFERDWKKGKEDEKLIKDIMDDLLPNDQQ